MTTNKEPKQFHEITINLTPNEIKDLLKYIDYAKQEARKETLIEVEKMIDEYKKGLFFIKMPLFTSEQFSWIVKRFDELKQQLKQLGE